MDETPSAVFTSVGQSEQSATVIADAHGFRPQVVVLEVVELQRAVEQNPFPDGEPKAVQLYFLTEPATPDEQAIEALRANSERYVAAETVFYLHAPDGIGRSKLAAKVERCLGVATTARNLRTVNKLLAMAAEA